MLFLEIISFKNSGFALDYFSLQNIVDLISIVTTIVYCLIRIAHPFGAELNSDNLEAGLLLPYTKFMPGLCVLVLTLTLNQWLFYLLTFSFLSKWIKLLYKSILLTIGFIVLFVIYLAQFFFMYKSLGCSFDDGGNYEKADESGEGGYDDTHNDY